MKLPPEIQKLMSDMWADIDRASREREEADAKANPYEHRHSMIMERGKSTRYHWYQGPPNTRYCYSQHRNVAGYYLAWIERETKREVNRSAFTPFKAKKDAIAHCKWWLKTRP